MDPHVAMTIDKLPDPGGAMGREIIGNNVNLLALGKAGHDLFKESNKLGASVTRCGLTQHLAGFGVERGVERKRAVGGSTQNRVARLFRARVARPDRAGPKPGWRSFRRRKRR